MTESKETKSSMTLPQDIGEVEIKCAICGIKTATENHHLIPKYVIKRINPNCTFRNVTAPLCDLCHNELHMSFINHAVMKAHKAKDYNRFDVIKYYACINFIQEHGLFKDWKKYWHQFLKESLEEFDNGTVMETKHE